MPCLVSLTGHWTFFFFYGSSSLLYNCACFHFTLKLENYAHPLLSPFFFFYCCNTKLLKLHNHASQFHPVKQLSVLRAKVLATITEFCCVGSGLLLSNWKSTMGSWLAYLSEVIVWRKKNAWVSCQHFVLFSTIFWDTSSLFFFKKHLRIFFNNYVDPVSLITA